MRIGERGKGKGADKENQFNGFVLFFSAYLSSLVLSLSSAIQ